MTYISVGKVLNKSTGSASFGGGVVGMGLQPRPSSVHLLFGSRSLKARRLEGVVSILDFQPQRLCRRRSFSSASLSSGEGGRLTGGEEKVASLLPCWR